MISRRGTQIGKKAGDARSARRCTAADERRKMRAQLSESLHFFDLLYVTEASGIQSQRRRTFNETYLPVRGAAPMLLRALAPLPFIGILLGVPFVNRVEPLVLGMPFVLAWLVMWVVLSSIIMAIIYRLDPRT